MGEGVGYDFRSAAPSHTHIRSRYVSYVSLSYRARALVSMRGERMSARLGTCSLVNGRGG